MTTKNPKIVGIIPAAGKANRLGKLPFSKELFPIGFDHASSTKNLKVVSMELLDCMTRAGVTQFHFVLRNGKWDIPAYYGSGSQIGCQLCYHITDYEYGVPFSVNQAFSFIKDNIVFFGFPDIIFRPVNAYKKLINILIEEDDTSIVLGLFPTQKVEKYDMVSFDEDQNIIDIKIKKAIQDQSKYAWVIAAWNPEFSGFINEYVENELATKTTDELNAKDYHLGDVIISAIKKGLKIKGVTFEKGKFIDIGTHEDLELANIFQQ